MAKGGPEVGNTVPIKDANGNITGWTTPEYAANLGISTDPGFALEGQTTGYLDDNSAVVMIDPTTGKSVTKQVGDDLFQYNPRGDETNWAYDAAGNRILMDTTAENWEDFGAFNPELEGFQIGYVPPVYESRPGDGLTLGPGDRDPTGQPPTGQPPTTTNPLPPTETPLPPDTNNPTDDWNPIDWDDYIGYENVPLPDGDGSFEEGGPPPDTSWDWSFFRDRAPGDRQWGGYDEDYQAFERYIPGMDSPWGLPNVKGGNEDFYQQQFLNQLRDEQGYQNRERAAQMRRQAAPEPQDISGEDMWSWAYGGQGLPDVTMGSGSVEPTGYSLNRGLSDQSTINDILRWGSTSEGFDADTRKFFEQHRKDIARTGGNLDSTAWARAGDPNILINRIAGQEAGGFNPQNISRMSELFNAIYNPNAQGPMAPVNYASPVQWGSSYPGAVSGGS